MSGYSTGVTRAWWEVDQWSHRTDPNLIAAMQQLAAQQAQAQAAKPIKVGVETYPTHELVMELIARGFAVAKLPAEEMAEEVAGG